MTDACPFGPEYQTYWNLRYELFSKFDEAKVDAHGLYTMIPEKWALIMAEQARGTKVLDVCSGLGSMSIAFARLGKSVTAVEIEPDRVAMARHNAQLYGVVDKIEFRTQDITTPEALQSLPRHIDTLWIDPPWGKTANEYRSMPIIHLRDLDLDGVDLRELASQIDCKDVLFRIPRNFDVGIFADTDCGKFKFAASKGQIIWLYLHMTKQQFLDLPDRSK